MLARRWIRLSLWSGSVKIKGLLRFARNDTMGAGNDTMGLAMKRASRGQDAFENDKH